MGCPMGFGELNIPSSRAFWDDCDEDELPQKTAERLKLAYINEEDAAKATSNCDLLFLIEGPNIAEFGESTLLKGATKLAEIPMKRSSLHIIPGKRMMVAILEEDLTFSGEVAELLLSYARPRDVITLTIKPKVDYKSEHIELVRDEITFLRGIDAKLNYVEPLEAPNFISGVAAGIASWRSNEGLSVQSYVAYTDNIALDALAARPILNLLHDLGVECSTTYTPKDKDDSHLYM